MGFNLGVKGLKIKDQEQILTRFQF